MKHSHKGVDVPETGVLAEAVVRRLRGLSADAIGPYPTTWTSLASVFRELAWQPPTKQHATDAIEDVRECARLQEHGLAYLGSEVLGKGHPHVGHVYLREWIESGNDAVRANCERRGFDYALMRRIVVERIVPQRAKPRKTDKHSLALSFD
jgi:hypothetical protein